MYEILTDRTNTLQEKYDIVVKKFAETADQGKISTKLPSIASKYQKHYYDLLMYYNQLSDEYERYYHQQLHDYKMSTSNLALLGNLNASELKTLIETSEEGRKYRKYMSDIKAQMKLVESQIETIKGYTFNISNFVKFQDLVGGI